MIWTWLFDVFGAWLVALVSPVLDLIPPPPAWVGTGFGYLSAFMGFLESFETWIPVDLALSAAGVVLAVYSVHVVIGIVRVVASYLTFGGGAT